MKKLSNQKMPISFSSGVRKVAYIEWRALLNNKQMIYSQLLVPVLYFLFYSIGISSTFGSMIYANMEVSFLKFSFIGILGLTLFGQMAQSVYRIILDRKWGLLAFKYFKGISPMSYFFGKMAFPLLSYLAQIIVLYIISIMVGEYFTIKEFLVIIVFSLIAMIFWFSLGTIIALRISSYKTRDLILNTFLVPISFTAPTFFSFDSAPKIIQILSAFNPLTYQLNAMRDWAFRLGNFKNMTIVLILTIIILIYAQFSVKNADLSSDEH